MNRITAIERYLMNRMRDLGGLYPSECDAYEKDAVIQLAKRGLVDTDGTQRWMFASLTDDGRKVLVDK